MGQVVCKCGINREKGYLYFLDKKGNVVRVQMARKGERTSKRHQILYEAGIKKKEGYLYYIDKHGNVVETLMQRARSPNHKRIEKQNKREISIKKDVDVNQLKCPKCGSDMIDGCRAGIIFETISLNDDGKITTDAVDGVINNYDFLVINCSKCYEDITDELKPQIDKVLHDQKTT